MENTRLINLLKTFSPDEMKNFEKFVLSPYFSKGRNLMPLYNILRKNHPVFQTDKLTHEKIFKKLFPGKKFVKKKSPHLINVIISELTQLAEKFLAFEYLQTENSGYSVYNALINSLSNRNMNKYVHKLIVNNIERIQHLKSNAFFFQEMTRLNSELAGSYFFLNKFSEASICLEKMKLYNYGNNLEAFGSILNTEKALPSFNANPSKNSDYFTTGLKSFDPVIFENEYYDDGMGTKQLILTNYYIIKSHLNMDDEESFLTAITHFKRDYDKLSWDNKYGYFIRLINICMPRAFNPNAGLKYFLIGSELVDFALSKRIYGHIEGGALTYHYFVLYFGFKNTVLKLKELEVFTNMLLELVSAKDRQTLYEYSYIWINFKKRNYEKTLELISKAGKLPAGLKNIISKIKILSLYSLNYIEETIYNLDSYEHFARSGLAGKGEVNIMDAAFIKAIRLFINCKINKISFDEHSIYKAIEEYKNFNINPWFKEEIERLKKAGGKPA